MDFELQGETRTFPGWGEVRLEAGYEWDKEARVIGAPVISLRDGRNKIKWVHELPVAAGSSGATVSRPAGSGAPALPVVEAPGRDSSEGTGAKGT